ncbi:MAG: acyloxyacyl hydrolase [Sphingosinicella sp.]
MKDGKLRNLKPSALAILFCACAGLVEDRAIARELFGGVLAHDIASPLTLGGLEDGADLQIGWRGDRLRALDFLGSPSPYAFVSAATGGETHFAAAGLSWRIGNRWFVRPGLGLAVHSRGEHGVAGGFRTDLGSRVLFELELGAGYQASERLAIELSWIHISNAQLFARQNPGMDSVGLRVSYRLR